MLKSAHTLTLKCMQGYYDIITQCNNLLKFLGGFSLKRFFPVKTAQLVVRYTGTQKVRVQILLSPNEFSNKERLLEKFYAVRHKILRD